MKKSHKPNRSRPRLASPWALFMGSYADFKKGWLPYLKILLVVALPTNLFLYFDSVATDAMASSYISFAAFIMNVALLWAITRGQATGRIPNVPASYYEGSAAIVRYLLVNFAVVFMLIPAAMGLLLYSIGLYSVGVNGIFNIEQLLVGLGALILASPSMFLLVRFGLAPVAAIRDNLRPVASLRYSRRLTLGLFWQTAVRFIAMMIFILLISIPATLVTAAFGVVNQTNIGVAFFQLATTLTALPFANLYMLRLYAELERAQASIKTDENLATID